MVAILVQLESVKEKLLADQFCYLQLWDPIKAKPCKIKIHVEFGVKIIGFILHHDFGKRYALQSCNNKALYFGSDFEGVLG